MSSRARRATWTPWPTTGPEACGQRVHAAGWTYPDPSPGYEALRDHVAFYPDRVDGAWMDDERVHAQPGGFYGGWITAELVGPFKGPPDDELRAALG